MIKVIADKDMRTETVEDGVEQGHKLSSGIHLNGVRKQGIKRQTYPVLMCCLFMSGRSADEIARTYFDASSTAVMIRIATVLA